jgi:Big-like domain-containing protein
MTGRRTADAGGARRPPIASLWIVAAALAGLVLTAASATSQPATRRATNVAALLAYPNFFHNQQVVLHGEFADVGQTHRFRTEDGGETVQAIGKVGSPGSPQEVRAEFYDAGRLTREDPRMTPELAATIEQQFGDRWPRPGEALVLNVLSSQPLSRPPAPTVRTVALDPNRYKDQRVTLTGQFRGRNLYGDLPNAPGVSKWDFVLKVADGAVWVTGIRPKAKNIDLDVAARVDTSRWVEVSGVVRTGKGLTWIDAEGGTFAAGKAPQDETPSEPPPAPSVGPSPEVIFSAPTEGEGDVPLTTSVRLQFSRDLDPSTIKGRVHVSYLTQEAIERGEPAAPPMADFTVQYVDANRMIDVKFTKPLERFRTVKVVLDPAITARDGAPLKPFTLTFMVGGSRN